MAFNIHQSIVDADGMPVERKARRYQKQLLELFEQSPEGQALRDEGGEPDQVSIMVDFGINYLGLTPPQLSPADLQEILFNLYPRKLSAPAEAAAEMIQELRYFWQFLQREFQLENAAACLKVLDDKAVRKLEKELGNPANYGIAKSFVMMGMERGFDVFSEEGINEWMETYNRELAEGTGKRIPTPSFLGLPDAFDQGSPGPKKTQSKVKRTAKGSQRKSRRKK